MPTHRSWSSWSLWSCTVILLLAVAGTIGWLYKDQLQVLAYARLALAQDEPTPAVKGWLLQHPSLMLPTLLDNLATLNAGRAGRLARDVLQEHHDPTNPHHTQMALAAASWLKTHYLTLPIEGRMEASRISFAILRHHLSVWSPNAAVALETAGAVYLASLHDDANRVKQSALDYLAEVWSWQGADGVAAPLVEHWRRDCYRSAVGLLDAEDELRLAAAAAVAGAPFHEGDAQLIALLDDPNRAVRKVALTTVARSAADSLSASQKQHVAQHLGDADADVRSAARRLLLNAGVSPEIVELAALAKHPDAVQRAKAVALTQSAGDPIPWLLDLSKDASPAVRLAVARAVGKTEHPALRERLKQFALQDDDRIVRETAQKILGGRLADARN